MGVALPKNPRPDIKTILKSFLLYDSPYTRYAVSAHIVLINTTGIQVPSVDAFSSLKMPIFPLPVRFL